MYESFWNLSGKPFTHRCEPSSAYPGRSFQAAMLRLRFAIDNQSGPVAVAGPSGVGKSLLVRRLTMDSQGRNPLVHMLFPCLTPTEMLRMIVAELRGRDRHASVAGLSTDSLLYLAEVAIAEQNQQQRIPVICLDDAHLLSSEVLQQVVQPLLNLADRGTDLSFSIVLCGQPVVLTQLSRQSTLNERIAMIAVLDGFSRNETEDFLVTALQNVGGAPAIFTPDAIERLFQLSGGNPRRIVRLADMALLVGFAEQLDVITSDEIDSLSVELLSRNAA
ncbi:MAG: AAA family ATPase [Planctomycetaceae bacterium]|nr:AAA family ATPase [Planctomycetaceae bacterium]